MIDTYNPFDAAALRLRRRYPNVDTVQPPQGPNDILDTIRSMPRGMLTGLGNQATALGSAVGAEMGQPEIAQGMGDKHQFTQAIEQNITGPLHQPQTPGGHFGATIGEVMGNPSNWVGPGSIPYKAAYNLASGVGSEESARMAPEGSEHLARPVGSWTPAVIERIAPFLKFKGLLGK